MKNNIKRHVSGFRLERRHRQELEWLYDKFDELYLLRRKLKKTNPNSITGAEMEILAGTLNVALTAAVRANDKANFGRN